MDDDGGDNIVNPTGGATALPDPGIGKRVKGTLYMVSGRGLRVWNGTQLVLSKTSRKSTYPGVYWHSKSGKWSGIASDRSVRVGRNHKLVHVGLFDDEKACAEAAAAKREEIEVAIANKLHEMAQELPHTRNLPLRPTNAADAAPYTAYYGEMRNCENRGDAKVFGPTRWVRTTCKHSTNGARFKPCCQAFLGSGEPCTQVAHKNGNCLLHGGGPSTGEGGSAHCVYCKTTYLNRKRLKRNGGNGLCAGCEARLNAEAAAAGVDAPPAPTERWEDLVFRKLLPLVTYADGAPFPPDQRDERRGGGLGTSKAVKRRRECDTTTNRFPDGLWVLRDARDGRALLVVIVEVDEHSHSDRDPACESGKIDDTFQALQDRLQKEGAATGAAARHGAYMVPIVFVKLNPNAYDGPRTGLDARVATVAALVNSYAHKSADELEDLDCRAPIVHVLYYHSKEGAPLLAHFAAKAPAAGWAYTVH